MHRRANTDTVRLPKLQDKDLRRRSLPSISGGFTVQPSKHEGHQNILPQLSSIRQLTQVHLPRNSLPEPLRRRQQSALDPLHVSRQGTIRRLPANQSPPQTRDKEENPAEKECEDKASHLLSITKQTADSIVCMMGILYKQLHPNTDYSESSEHKQHNRRKPTQQAFKSILKTLPIDRVGAHHPNVRINPSMPETSVYAKHRSGLLTNFQFSTEFNDVYAELTQ